jgi:hypothetical protein
LLLSRLLASLGSLLSGSCGLCLCFFFGHVARRLGLFLLGPALLAQTVAVGDDPDDFFVLALDVLDDAFDGLLVSTANDLPFARSRDGVHTH